MEWMFWSAVGVILYVYLGYPIVLACGASLRSRLVRKGVWTPSVSVVMAAHNEAEIVRAKIENLLSLHFPADRLEILVVSDGSTDGTDEIASGYHSCGVRVLRLPVHQGKAGALNAGAAAARGELVVFVDARQRLQTMALRRLAANFCDETVGAVSGRLLLGGDGRATEGFGTYWNYELWIRRHESRIDSMVGATGALYAIRRALWEPLPPDTILDDVLVPMRILLKGHRIVYEPEAIAFDQLADHVPDEFSRKVRTLAGNFQLLWRYPEWLIPTRNRVWFQYLSHKVGRLVVPPYLLLVLLSSAVLNEGLYAVAFHLQLLWYGVAACVGVPRLHRFADRAVSAATAVAAMNLAVVLGLAYIMAGRRDLWRRPAVVQAQATAQPVAQVSQSEDHSHAMAPR
jgi:cellulose synthase/poly-beta-1,6-N-acetylglucosamine synthase-like glycosyltransferase